MNTIALTMLAAVTACVLALALAWYGVVAWALYEDERERFGTDPRAARRFALTWPQRAYSEWTAT